jgi:hypothetical protein
MNAIGKEDRGRHGLASNPWHVNGSVAAGCVEGILLAARRRGLRIPGMKVERRISNYGP